MGQVAQPVIQSLGTSNGHPLEYSLGARFGAQLHDNFSDVRIHADEHAAQMANAVDAKAFTVGKDIVFGANQYQPQSAQGQHLLAHELAHVAQPSSSGAQGLSRPGDASEQEASHAADAIMQGRDAVTQVASPAAIQREPNDANDQTSHQSVLDRMLDQASPFLATAVGSATISDFDTGKAELKPAHLKDVHKTAQAIVTLLRQYPQSTVVITGHTDTVGTESNNLALGQARALSVAQAMEDFGVPQDIVQTRSQGEAAPQAVKTRDDVSSGQNRRVDIRFEPKAAPHIDLIPKIEPPSPTQKDDTPTPPPIDFNYHGSTVPERQGPYRHDDSPPNLWTPVPPLPKGAGPKSAIDIIGEKLIDPIVDGVAHGLSKDKRAKIKEAARAGVQKGIAKLARAAAQAEGVKDPQALDAIENAAAAAIRQSGSDGRETGPSWGAGKRD